AIQATNRVFQSLAQRFPEVCHFDLAMMSKIVGPDIIHDEWSVAAMSAGSSSSNADSLLSVAFQKMLITRRFPSATDILTSFAEGVQDAGSISHAVEQLVLTIEITSGWWAFWFWNSIGGGIKIR